MVTKLRNISTNTITKTVAWILLAVSVFMATYTFFDAFTTALRKGETDSLYVVNYTDSNSFHDDIFNVRNKFFTWLTDDTTPEFYGLGSNMYYRAEKNDNVITNVVDKDKSFFKQYKAYYIFELKDGVCSHDSSLSTSNYVPKMSGNALVYFAISDSYIEQMKYNWDINRKYYIAKFNFVLFWLVSSILLSIYLIVTTGRKAQDNELHLSVIDKIYSDINILILSSYYFIGYSFVMFIYNPYTFYKNTPFLTAAGLCNAIVFLCFMMLFLSLVRKIKAGQFIKHSLIYIILKQIWKLVRKIFDSLKSLFDGRKFSKYPLTKSLFYRQFVYIVVSAFLMFLFIIIGIRFWILILFELVITGWYIVGNRKTFTEINKGFNESFEEQMKAERTKTALIANVSHDLKTPLTSIITYIDLLSKEENLSDTVKDYITILSQKSERLKNIVSDLFDLSKSASGNIKLDMETLDLKRLIEQTLADMKDLIESTGFTFKIKLPNHAVNIYSDGKKLYRVFQNVIDNALKYSLEGTRVFITLDVKDGRAIASVKNTSAYEIDFTAEEILQRFNRGDKSRSSEGSGLGLSIAESFTKACGGDFKVEIDGDLFKVKILFDII